MKDTATIEVGVNELRPILGEDGRKLTDLQLAKNAIKNIKEVEEKTGKATSIDPAFREFLEGMIEECDPEVSENPITTEQYKKKHIVRTIPDYSMLKGVVK